MPDTVTANGEGFVVLGTVIRETLCASPVRTLSALQTASEASDDVAEPGDALDDCAPEGAS